MLYLLALLFTISPLSEQIDPAYTQEGFWSGNLQTFIDPSCYLRFKPNWTFTMNQIPSSYAPQYGDYYYLRGNNASSYEPNSEEERLNAIPQSDFNPYYSDLASYDSEIDNNFLNIQELNIPQGVAGSDYIPGSKLQQFVPQNLSSEPPLQPYMISVQQEPPCTTEFDEIPSSPPSSPPRAFPSSPYHARNKPNLDSLGISHPYGHRYQPSISRIMSSMADPLSSSIELAPSSAPASAMGNNSLQSPFLMPPFPQDPTSPYERSSPKMMYPEKPLPYPSIPVSSSTSEGMPNLSPALSDASSVSPDPQYSEHEGFSWQPIVTVPRSEITENIIEQQRKPRQKRKTCLPEGVVEEYVGLTDVEGVYMCLYPNCQRLFKRTYNLRSHVQTHLCDRPYVCKTCDANFVRPHDLRRHERSHSNAKPYTCPCGKGFSRQDAMQRHRLREICEGAISSGIPKSPKPRGRPKGRKNSPSHSPLLDKSPNMLSPGSLKQSPILKQDEEPLES